MTCPNADPITSLVHRYNSTLKDIRFLLSEIREGVAKFRFLQNLENVNLREIKVTDSDVIMGHWDTIPRDAWTKVGDSMEALAKALEAKSEMEDCLRGHGLTDIIRPDPTLYRGWAG